MISKRVEGANAKNRLLKVIDMKTFESEIQKLVYDEFGEELELKDKKIESQSKEIESQSKEIDKLIESNNAYRSKVEQLKKIGDLNSSNAQEIIQSLMLL